MDNLRYQYMELILEEMQTGLRPRDHQVRQGIMVETTESSVLGNDTSDDSMGSE
jgi:hypothetical protein